MNFNASLLVPTMRRSWDMATAMRQTMLIAWLGTMLLGVLCDVGVERSGGTGSGITLLYGVATTFIQVWVTRAGLQLAGVEPALPTGNALSLYLQGLLVGLGIVAGLLLLILPGLYLFARWYLAGVLLVQKGSGRRAAMERSWNMLEAHWPAALGVGLIMVLLSAGPILIELTAPGLAIEYGFAWRIASNLVSALGLVGGYLAAVALYLNIEQPASTLREIFG